MAEMKELVRREKDLMVRFINAHKEGDHKNRAGIQKEIARNVEQRRDAK